MQFDNKEKKRLILIDLDGTTLCNDHTTIHPKTSTAIAKAIDQGHIICICTGRAVKDAMKIYTKLNLNTLLVSLDGGHISDPVNKSFKRIVLPISEEIIKGIFAHPILENKISNAIVEYYHKSMILNPSDKFFSLDPHDEIEGGDIISEWVGPCSNLIIKLKSVKNLNEVISKLNATFGNSINVKSNLIYGVQNISENPILIVTNKFVSKAFAAEMVAQYYNKDLKEVIAFGDQMNDFEMIQAVGFGIALVSGNEELKKVAWKITTFSNEQGGLGDTLTNLLDL